MRSWKLEKRKVVRGAEVIKEVGDHFRVVTEGGWRGIEDTVDGTFDQRSEVGTVEQFFDVSR